MLLGNRMFNKKPRRIRVIIYIRDQIILSGVIGSSLILFPVA